MGADILFARSIHIKNKIRKKGYEPGFIGFPGFTGSAAAVNSLSDSNDMSHSYASDKEKETHQYDCDR